MKEYITGQKNVDEHTRRKEKERKREEEGERRKRKRISHQGETESVMMLSRHVDDRQDEPC